MLRRLFLGLLPVPLSAGLRDWRVHAMARVWCKNGPVVVLLVRGDLAKLTEHEREALMTVAEELGRL